MIGVAETLTGLLPELSNELAAVADRLRASVVLIRGQGAGSGVIWEGNGLIVTNHHVVSGERAEVVLADGRVMAGWVVARDPEEDLAVVRVPAVGLPAVETRPAASLRVGELVLAAGNPFGQRGAVTAGIVSAIGGGLMIGGRHTARRRDIVQADVELLPGNSGGALADASGRVVGINAMVAGPRLGLAVPTEAVTRLLGEAGTRRGRIGVELSPVPLPAAAAAQAGTSVGLIILAVEQGGPADRAGLMVGDVLVGLDGTPLRDPGQLARGLRSAGQVVRVAVLRGGVRRDLQAVPEAA